jgi:hypothetical protein
MRKTLLLTFLLLACAAWVAAQQDAGPQAASGQSTIEGCLGGGAGMFTVTDMAGNSYQLQLPPSADTAKLNQHIGHEVRVTGMMSNAGGSASAPAAPPRPGAGATPGAAETGANNAGAMPTINVSKMDKIADTCTMASPAPSK